MARLAERPKPFLVSDYCKGCGRCIASCTKNCFTLGTEINPATGLFPISMDLQKCNGCGLCIDACPEPFGLCPDGEQSAFDAVDPVLLGGIRPFDAPIPERRPDVIVDVPEREPLVVKGTYAVALGALFAGCRHVYGYPITPSTEGAELMARTLPKLDGIFIQAVSEVAAVNIMYGAGGAGKRCMSFTSSPGFSLMQEGISYLIGAEVPAVFVDIMRGGPGLGNIGPEQSDIKLICRGLGHGNTHAIVLAPATPQEMLDLSMLAFDLAFKYRNPVVLAADGYLGQMTGKVRLPNHMIEPGIPEWAVSGDRSHRGNLICSIDLTETDLELHNEHLNRKYARMVESEQRSDLFQCEDAEVLLVACNTPAQLAKGAVQELRAQGLKVGLFRPITLWPFPIDALVATLPSVQRLVIVEASSGQLEDELRLAVSHAGVPLPQTTHVRRMGGILPSQDEIVAHVVWLDAHVTDLEEAH